MANSLTNLDLTKIPFGRTRSRFMVFEENNLDRESRRNRPEALIPRIYPVQTGDPEDVDFAPGLYFAVCAQGGNAPRRRGLVDIVPVSNGEPVPYTYKATPSLLQIDTAKGNIRVTMDTERTMRIAGDGGIVVKLHFDLPFLSMMTAQLLPSGVVDFNLRGVNSGGGAFFFHTIKGEILLDSKFDPLLNGAAYVHAEFLPDANGEFEIAAYSMSPDEWGYIDYRPFDECVADTQKTFDAFLAKFPKVGEKWQNLRELSAYALWINYQAKSTSPVLPTLKSDMIYSSVMNEGQALAYEQPLFSMAFADLQEAMKVLTNNFAHMQNGMLPMAMSDTKPYFKAFPPTFGVAALYFLENGGDKLPKDELKALYQPLAEHYEWWIKSHSLSEGHISYNARDEYGFKGTSYGTLSFPLEAPDLYTYLIVYADALAKLSALVGDGKETKWANASKQMLDSLLTLWNGESFDCRDAVSGVAQPSDSLLTCLPIYLGKKLPDDVRTALIERLSDEEGFLSARGFRSESKKSPYYDGAAAGRGAVDAAQQMFIIGGLFRSDAGAFAEKAALRLLDAADQLGARNSIAAEGDLPVRRPADEINAISGAALIYLANMLFNGGKE